MITAMVMGIYFKIDGTMKNLFKLVGCLALATVLFSCNKETEKNIPEVEKHWVKVVASPNATTRTMLVEADKSTVWTERDKDNIHLFENGVAPDESEFIADISNDDILTMMAAFSGTAPFEYTSILASDLDESTFVATIPDMQEMVEGSFDPDADILVADPQKYDVAQEEFTFQYARVVAVNKMTIKGLTSGDKMVSVTIKSDKPILGSYDMTSYEWTNSGDQLELSYKGENVIGSDESWPVYFITAPVEGATLTINVQTNNHEYEKEFTKTINFPQNTFTTFATTVAGCEVTPEVGPKYDWTLASGDLGSTGSPLASVSKGTPAITWSADYTWGGDGATKYFGFESARGVQIGAGSAANKCSSLVLSTSGYTGNIQNVLINFAQAKDGGASVSVTVGGTSLTCEDNTSVNATTSSADYLFTSTSLLKGNVVISFTNSAPKAFYVKSISINPDLREVQTLSFPEDAYAVELTEGTFAAPTLSGAHTTVTYDSSDKTVATVADDGTVTLLKTGATTITATAEANDNYQEGSASYELTVNPGPSTIAEVIAADVDASVYTTGIVAQVNLRGFIITDDTNSILVYENATPDVVEGQSVKVSGTRAAYNGLPQISSPVITKGATGQTINRGEPTVITSANATGYTTCNYVSLTGTLTISGNYTNIAIEGSTTQGSLYQFDNTTVTGMDGKKVTVLGYVVGSTSKYLNIAVVDITLLPYVDYTAPEKAGYADNSTTTIAVDANVTWTAAKGTDNDNIIKSVTYNANTITVTFNANTDDAEKSATVVITPAASSGLSAIDVTVLQNKNGVAPIPSDETFSFSTMGYSNGEEVSSVSGTNVNLSFTDGSTATAYYDTGAGIRIYGGGTFTATASGNHKIKEIVCTYSAAGNAPNATSTNANYATVTTTGTEDNGTLTYGVSSTWTCATNDPATSVTITRNTGSGHWRLQSVVVKFAE